LFAVVVALHATAALLAPGFFHPDEHYQTIEWASALLGRTGEEQLTWELRAQIRSFLQPMFYAAIAKLAGAAGVGDPYDLALLFRLASAALGVGGIVALAAAIPKWFDSEDERRTATVALSVFYFLPLLHVRTSSENLAGSVLMIAVYALVTKRGFLAGLLFGAAFFLRYPAGLMVLGALIYVVFIEKRRGRALSSIFAGLLVALILGTGCDRIGYGEWVFAPYRYFTVNLVEGTAASFGVDPAWKYAGWFWHDLIKPLGAIVILAPFAAAIRQPRHLLVWLTLPFIVAHLFIAHKEPRFMYLVLGFVPVLAVLALSPELGRIRHRAKGIALSGILAINLWALLTGGFHPALFAGRWMEHTDVSLPLVFDAREPYGADLHPTFFHVPRASREPPASGAYQLLHDAATPHARPPPGCEEIFRDPPLARLVPITEKASRRVFGITQVVQLYRCRTITIPWRSRASRRARATSRVRRLASARARRFAGNRPCP
jgi:hypothetical protein